jgi:GLPGLI family protein
MKIIYSFLFTLCFLTLNAQIFNGSLIYGVKVGTDEFFENIPKSMRESHIIDEESKVFTLSFDKNKSIFNYEGGLSKDGASKKPISYFREKDSLYSLRPENYSDFGKIIIIEDRNTAWKLENETKIIDGYLCYKATAELVRKNGDKVFKFPIIAWYCPTIPFPFGPLGYGGLPGLILQLQERNVVYGIQKMNFNDQKMNLIIKPIVGKRITEAELNKKIEERMFIKHN